MAEDVVEMEDIQTDEATGIVPTLHYCPHLHPYTLTHRNRSHYSDD